MECSEKLRSTLLTDGKWKDIRIPSEVTFADALNEYGVQCEVEGKDCKLTYANGERVNTIYSVGWPFQVDRREHVTKKGSLSPISYAPNYSYISANRWRICAEWERVNGEGIAVLGVQCDDGHTAISRDTRWATYFPSTGEWKDD